MNLRIPLLFLMVSLAMLMGNKAIAQPGGNVMQPKGLFIEAEDFDGVISFPTWQTLEGSWYAKEHLNVLASGGAYAVANEYSLGAVMEKTLPADLPAGRHAVWLRVGCWYDSDNAVEVDLNGATTQYSWTTPKTRGYRWLRQVITTTHAGNRIRIKAVKAEQKLFGETPVPPCRFLVIDTVYIGPPDEKLRIVTHDNRQMADELEVDSPAAPGAPGNAGHDAPRIDATPIAPPQGNIIQNGSFEVGVAHGWGTNLSSRDHVISDALIEPGGVHGASCFRSIMPDGRTRFASLLSRPYALPAGRYTAAIQVKSPLKTKVSLSLMQVGKEKDKAILTASTPGADRWDRLEVTGELGAGDYYIEVAGNGVFRVDAVQLVAGEHAGDYQPATPIELGLSSDIPGHVYYADEPVMVNMLSAIAGDRPSDDTPATCVVYDLWNRPVLKRVVKVSGGAADRKQALDLTPGRTGIFRAELEIEGLPRTRDELVFSVLPRPSTPDVDPASWLGAMPEYKPYVLASLQRAGFKWSQDIRYAAVGRWLRAEPKPGQIIWHDDDIALPRQYGMEPIVLLHVSLGGLPKWVEPSATNKFVPRDIELWKSFVFRTVDHYKDKVKYWQFSDDIHHFFNAEEYAMLQQATYEAAKKADPTCKVIGWRYYAREVPGSESLMQRVAPYADILYGAQRDTREAYGKPVQDYRFVSGPTMYNFPAAGVRKEIQQLDQARREATGRVFNAFAQYAADMGQVDQLFLYKANLGRNPATTYLSKDSHEFDGTLHIGVVLYRMLNAILPEARCLGPIQTDRAVRAYLFQRADAAVALVWTRGGREAAVTLPSTHDGLEILDAMGNAITPLQTGEGIRLAMTDTPCIITLPGQSAAKLEAALAQAKVTPKVAIHTTVASTSQGLQYEVSLTNNAPMDMPMRVEIPSPIYLFPLRAGASAQVDLGVVPPGQTRTAILPMRYGFDRSVEFKSLNVEAQAGDNRFSVSRQLWLCSARPVRGALDSNGMPADWPAAQPSRLATTNASSTTRRMSQVLSGAITGEEAMTQGMAPIIGGDQDISAAFFAQWDSRSLYLAADVRDDRVETGDRIEFLLRPDATGVLRRVACDAVSSESTAELLADGAGQAVRLPVVRKPIEGGYRVEVALPWSALDIQPAAGRVMLLDAVLTDIDQATPHAKMVWSASSNIGDPATMGFLVLGESSK